MKKNTYATAFLSFILMLTLTTSSFAQGLLFEVPLSTQVDASSEIIEGKVISKTSYWDKNHKNIYTVNTIKVYKIFKGQTPSETIDIITPGGTVGLDSEVVTPSLTLDLNDIGLFMLHQNDVEITNGTIQPMFKPFASSQGFYKYNLKKNTVHNPFLTRQGITNTFYNEIKSLTGIRNVIEVSEFDANAAFQNANTNRNIEGTIMISNLAPTTVNGGVRDQLTISGIGFGTDGTVEFRDANSGGQDNLGDPVYYAAKASQIISWTDSEIVVEVPSRAGTGDVRVTPTLGGAGSEVVSSQILTVFYSQINPSTGPIDFPSQHFDTNGNGGYTWQMQTDFDANAPAKASFLRAFDSWVCTTGINWEIGTVTTVDEIASDGINIIRFDNGTELPQGVLGRCTSRFGSCSSGSVGGLDIVVTELDIVFNDVFTGDFSVLSWEFGPDTATGFEVDFESVAVHELGHGHQLAHIIDPGEVMHYSIANGQNSRDLGSSDFDGATDVMTRNVNNQVCGQDLMTYSLCSGLTLSLNENTISENITIYPNPVKHHLNIASAAQVKLETIDILDLRGRLVLSRDLNPVKSLHTIDVSQLHSGIYMIRINVENHSISQKFIVE